MTLRLSLPTLRTTLFSALLSLSTLTCLYAQRPSPAAGTGQVWHLHREEKAENVTDPATQQSHRMGIMNMLLPDGWKLTLRPAASMDCAYNDGRLFISAATQDQSMGVVVLPAQASFYSNNRAVLQQRANFSQQFKVFTCNIEPPKPFEAGMREAAAKLVPDARIVGDVEPIAGLSDQLPQMVQSANARLAGNGERLSAEAGRLRITGTFNNHPVEMWLIVMRTIRTQPVFGGTSTLTDAPLLAVVYAPPGQLNANDRLLMTVLSSIQVDPDWTRFNQEGVARMLQIVANANATVARIHQQMAADNAAAAAQQAQIRAGAAQLRHPDPFQRRPEPRRRPRPQFPAVRPLHERSSHLQKPRHRRERPALQRLRPRLGLHHRQHQRLHPHRFRILRSQRSGRQRLLDPATSCALDLIAQIAT